MAKAKTVVGLTEKVRIQGKEVLARIDTGAKYNSIATELASELRLGPIVKSVTIKSSNGVEKRPVVQATLEIKGRKFKTGFTISDRSHLRYSALIGRGVLRREFLVDPTK